MLKNRKTLKEVVEQSCKFQTSYSTLPKLPSNKQLRFRLGHVEVQVLPQQLKRLLQVLNLLNLQDKICLKTGPFGNLPWKWWTQSAKTQKFHPFQRTPKCSSCRVPTRASWHSSLQTATTSSGLARFPVVTAGNQKEWTTPKNLRQIATMLLKQSTSTSE